MNRRHFLKALAAGTAATAAMLSGLPSRLGDGPPARKRDVVKGLAAVALAEGMLVAWDKLGRLVPAETGMQPVGMVGPGQTLIYRGQVTFENGTVRTEPGCKVMTLAEAAELK